MALSNLYGWSNDTETKAAAACGTACGAADAPEEKPAACGAANAPEEKPAACGAADAPEEKPAACGTGCGAADK